MAEKAFGRTVEKMYACCRRHNFFTMGTNEQYAKMFKMVEDADVTIVELAAVIYLCSEGYDRKEIVNIIRDEVVF